MLKVSGKRRRSPIGNNEAQAWPSQPSLRVAPDANARGPLVQTESLIGPGARTKLAPAEACIGIGYPY
jgi:hypothetical protein